MPLAAFNDESGPRPYDRGGLCRRRPPLSSGARRTSNRTATRHFGRLRSSRVTATTDRRLLASSPGAHRLLYLGVACGFVAAAMVIAEAYLTSVVVTGVFIDGRGLGVVLLPLALIAILAVLRTPLRWGADALAQRAAGRIKGRLRADLTERLFALGPAYTTRERSGELTAVMANGMDAIDAFVSTFEPARLLAVVIPLLVVAVVLVVDPPTSLVLLVTGPVLVLLLATIGGRTRAITDRRFREMRYLSAFFLDTLQGIATLKMFGRSREQVETVRDMSRRYGDTTMEVLRTAFQTSLVLEWGGAVAVALVAVEISLRLMAGEIPFGRALAILIIVPEFFLPLRQLATQYHSGSAGRTAADRVFAILDEPLPRGRINAATSLSSSPTSVPAARPGPGTDIRFVGVGFTYAGRSTPALNGLDMTIEGGRTTALVGPTGAGKTTLAGLLLRFIEPDEGRNRGRRHRARPARSGRLEGSRGLGPPAAVPVPWDGRRQHPAGPTRRVGSRCPAGGLGGRSERVH